LPLTNRQIFYRLVGVHGYPKIEKAYDRLGEMLNRARRAGLIPWEHIRDDGVIKIEPPCFQDTGDLICAIEGAVETFRLDRQAGQPVRLFFAVEAGGMVPQVERIVRDYGITVLSSGGFDSTTIKHELAGMAAAWPVVEILHIGDHDPSGVHVFSALSEDVQAFGGPEHDIRFTRLAVTRANYRPPPSDCATEADRPPRLQGRDGTGRSHRTGYPGWDHPGGHQQPHRPWHPRRGARRGGSRQGSIVAGPAGDHG
jgi:hypothetical protein